MNLPSYFLPPAQAGEAVHVRRFLWLGVLALAGAGIFAAMLAGGKGAYFYKALVAHVDLSVLVWFIAAGGIMAAQALGRAGGVLMQGGFISCLLAALLISAAVFTPGEPYQNNYVPVIFHPAFFLALALLFCGIGCIALRLLFAARLCMQTAFGQGMLISALMLAGTLFCFVWSFLHMPEGLAGESYFEQLFWAGGHMLQLVYTHWMVLAWLALADAGGIKRRHAPCFLLFCFGLAGISAAVGVMLSLLYAPATPQHYEGFTLLMKHGNGLPAILVALYLLPGMLKGGAALPRIALFMSMLLFGAGGALGHMITGSTVTVPAHYHGSIVGVTLAFMGLGYALLPSLGLADVSRWKTARLQPILYGGGQLFWMAGMAIGGAYGVGRKIPGSADVIGGIGGFLKHGGDGLSLIGGLLFVYVVIRAARKAKQ